MAKAQHESQQKEKRSQQGQERTESRGQIGGGNLTRATAQPLRQRGARYGGAPGQQWSDFDQLMESFFPWRRGGVEQFLPELRRGGLVGRPVQWGLDVDERDDQVIVRAEAPGFEKDDFDIQVHDNHLVLRAERQQESDQDGGRMWSRQDLYETVPLPTGIDRDKVNAQYRNGVLTVTLPRTEQSKGRRIEVKE